MPDALFDQGVRRLHIHNFGRAGKANTACAADEQNAVFIYPKIRAVQRSMVVFRSVKNNGAGLKRVLMPRCDEKPLPELVRNDRGFHQCRVKQIPP